MRKAWTRRLQNENDWGGIWCVLIKDKDLRRRNTLFFMQRLEDGDRKQRLKDGDRKQIKRENILLARPTHTHKRKRKFQGKKKQTKIYTPPWATMHPLRWRRKTSRKMSLCIKRREGADGTADGFSRTSTHSRWLVTIRPEPKHWDFFRKHINYYIFVQRSPPKCWNHMTLRIQRSKNAILTVTPKVSQDMFSDWSLLN